MNLSLHFALNKPIGDLLYPDLIRALYGSAPRIVRLEPKHRRTKGEQEAKERRSMCEPFPILSHYD